MCGRMVQVALKKLWRMREELTGIPPGFHPRYNIVPTSDVLVVRSGSSGWSAGMMRWGLIPSWWKDASAFPTQTFNARAETVATKPTFRSAFKRRRCIIPADGFYEWKTIAGKPKQPYFIHPSAAGEVFAFAGLWDYWETADGAMESCTIITTEPNALMAEIHHRMPVILPPQTIEEWLNPSDQGSARLQQLLVPSEPNLMSAHAVGPVKGEGPALIMPLI